MTGSCVMNLLHAPDTCCPGSDILGARVCSCLRYLTSLPELERRSVRCPLKQLAALFGSQFPCWWVLSRIHAGQVDAALLADGAITSTTAHTLWSQHGAPRGQMIGCWSPAFD